MHPLQRLKMQSVFAEDIAQLAQLAQQCLPEAWSQTAMMHALGNHYEFQQWTYKQQCIGFLLAQNIDSEAELLQFVIHPKHQGQGLGQIYLAQWLHEKQQQGTQQIFLELRASNHVARHLYQKLGFCEYGQRPSYYRPRQQGDKHETARLMRWIAA